MGKHGGRRAAATPRPSWTADLRERLSPTTVALGIAALVGGGGGAWVLDGALAEEESSEQRAAASQRAAAGTSASREPTSTGAPAPAREGVPSERGNDPLAKVAQQGVVARGSGEFAVVPVATGLTPDADAMTYTVEIEGGVKVKRDVLAATIDTVLGDARGWRAKGHVMARVATDPDFRILLASPDTTDVLCAPLETRGRVSCHNSSGDVVLNARRWTEGIPDYSGALVQYRTYLVNHEVGHHLGYQHTVCGGVGEPAPVMMQQTYGLKGCLRNEWPV